MLNRFELLFSFIGGWIVAIIIIIVLRLRRGKNLPNGSIILSPPLKTKEGFISGYNKWLLIGMGSISFLTFLVIFLSIFNYWNKFAMYYSIDFPYWLNWVGIIGIWIQDCWGGLVFAYNVNYTPAYKPMKENYVLATGGPYSIIRHPMYTAKAFLVIFFFLATGLWFSLLGIITWFVLPSQAKREEKALKEIFGKRYEDYYKNTGRFFPKTKSLMLKIH